VYNESKIMKLRLEQEYIYFQIDQKLHTYEDLERLKVIKKKLNKLIK
jgi:hypothetical protein